MPELAAPREERAVPREEKKASVADDTPQWMQGNGTHDKGQVKGKGNAKDKGKAGRRHLAFTLGSWPSGDKGSWPLHWQRQWMAHEDNEAEKRLRHWLPHEDKGKGKHQEVAVPREEVAFPREKPSDQPLAINPYSSLPSSSSMLDPSEDPSDSSVTDDEASQAGLLVHLMTNRVHVCSDYFRAQKTRCGLAFSNDLELKTTQISCSDLKCAKCFRIRQVPLPGRQAA